MDRLETPADAHQPAVDPQVVEQTGLEQKLLLSLEPTFKPLLRARGRRKVRSQLHMHSPRQGSSGRWVSFIIVVRIGCSGGGC